jgi:NAD(P)-dependent dehydrogenase (short-subunit alcohol dehydrogenase family)
MLPEPTKPTVLVTDAGRGSAIAIIRSLGRRGWRVIAADYDRRSLGFQSRHASERLIYPAPETSPQECIDTLHRCVQER